VTGLLSVADIATARERIAARVHRTPTMSASTIGEMLGLRLYLKAELFQKTGSFKIRGVFNKLLTLPSDDSRRGLVSLSAGNHAAALAYGATAVGARATIVMPRNAVRSKIEATRAYGGEVALTDGSLLDALHDLMASRRLTLIHPFDDLAIMAGQGTVGLEVLEDVPDLDAVIVPVGGGGLISGIATAVKSARPKVRVIGVEPTGADGVSRGLAAGRPVTLDRTTTIADGLAAPFAGEHTLRHIRELVDDIVLVDDEDIVTGLRLIMQRCKLAAEPSGAAALAALLSEAVSLPRASVVACVVGGGNVDLDTLKRIL
jgi:threonine dehydratase